MLMVFIHCATVEWAIKLWNYIKSCGYNMASSPIGFGGNGVLEMWKEDYLKFIEDPKHKWIMNQKNVVTEVVIEED